MTFNVSNHFRKQNLNNNNNNINKYIPLTYTGLLVLLQTELLLDHLEGMGFNQIVTPQADHSELSV